MAGRDRILVVDDDPVVAESLAEFLAGEGYGAATACDGNEAMRMLEAAQHGAGNVAPFGVVITDLNMPRCDGVELLRNIRESFESVVPIVITGFGKIETAVEAIKLGAVDYLTKPIVDEELLIAVSKGLRQHALIHENRTLRDQLSQRYGLDNIIGSDYRMQKVYDLVEAVAPSKTTVLIDGESGTGKSMIARAIHTRSPRGSGPFITFSCGSIPETLLESELFGHVKGAFTGADYDKPGKLKAADGGTLFIDEINSATPALQLKLLRVLQEKQFEPVGSTETISVDVRFVLATNQCLQELVEKGMFREDLFYRINVVNIHLPRLGDRLCDIPPLAEHFLAKYREETGKQITGFGAEALDALSSYHWPGNVRELENAVERAVVLCRGVTIGVEDLPDTIQATYRGERPKLRLARDADHGDGGSISVPALADGWTPTPLTEALMEPEKQIIRAALEANHWNRQETAKQLDINRTTLYKKIKQFRLDQPA